MIALGALIAGCGDDADENPMVPVDETPSRATPVDLLQRYFETAYASRDSALYAAMLDPEFKFEFLQADADSLRDILGSDNFWGRTLDLRSTGFLFRSPDVTAITLNLQVNNNNEYVGENCAGCRQLETTVTLRVATIGDGTEPLIFTVDSPQTFVAKLDTADSLWVLWQQIDRPRSAAQRDLDDAETATEGTTWGRIKGLFMPPSEGPHRRTPTELLTSFLTTAYATRDSALYAEMLCDDFQFEFLPQDADSLREILGVDNFWGRTLELRFIGGLFRNPEITSITLIVQIDSNGAYMGDDCNGCREIGATFTLRIATIGDGSDPLIYTLDSPQTFVAKPDPADARLWCLFRQFDRGGLGLARWRLGS